MAVDSGPSTTAAIHLAAFRAALRSYSVENERVARAHGLTPQRYLLLLMVKGAPDGSGRTTITELADRLKLAQSSVTELVTRAQQADLVTRERHAQDARVAQVSLTTEGERRLALVFTHLDVERERLREAL